MKLPAPALLCVAGLACSTAPSPPRLVVVISVDQMRADYADRFSDLFTGGLARLRERGAIFTDAQHAHGLTYTAPGHTVIATGVHPSRHGIVGNDIFIRSEGRETYALGDDDAPILGVPEAEGRSPRLILRETVGDWLREQSPDSKIHAVALKDRAAISMGGHRADDAYWYYRYNGRMVTSAYYRDNYPEWVDRFNWARPADSLYDDAWTRLLPEERYTASREDDFPAERNPTGPVFPHWLATTGEQPGTHYYRYTLPRTPYADERVIAFARELVVAENLGADAVPDLLFLGCSAADFLGHVYGPYSQEVEDYYLRLDGYLESFFRFLDERVGEEYAVVFTSDHGVSALPEELRRRGTDAGRFSGSDTRRYADSVVDAAVDAGLIAERPRVHLVERGITFEFENATPDPEAVRALRRHVADAMAALPYIADAFTSDELASDWVEGENPYLAALRRSFHPDRSGDVELLFAPHFFAESDTENTTHGSPYPHDTHVPLIVAGPGVAPGRHTERVYTVDIAPTVAALLGITPPGDLDGTSLLERIAR